MVLAVLATWRVTHLLASEDGPAAIIARLRERLGHGPLGKLMDCFKCLSLWIAAPMALLVAENLLDWLLCWLALSGAACLLQRLGPPPVVIEPIRDSTQGEDDDDMLRQQAGGGDRRL
jgi:hypothetical protein